MWPIFVMVKFSILVIFVPAHALHLFVFFPNKITVRSNCELKTVGAAAAAVGTAATASQNQNVEKSSKNQNFEQIMFRLVSFMASCAVLPYKSTIVSDDMSTVIFWVAYR